MPNWLKSLLAALGYACPSPAGELTGVLQCGPDLAKIQRMKELELKLKNALDDGDMVLAAEFSAEWEELKQELGQDIGECLKKGCCTKDEGK